MARALLTLAFSRTAHLTTAAKFAKKKIHVESLENRWLSGPQVAQLFCSARSIMARALLNFGCLRHCLHYHGSAPGRRNYQN